LILSDPPDEPVWGNYRFRASANKVKGKEILARFFGIFASREAWAFKMILMILKDGIPDCLLNSSGKEIYS